MFDIEFFDKSKLLMPVSSAAPSSAAPARISVSRQARSVPGSALRGTCRLPGDKSLSQRALICAALAIGESRLENMLDSADVRATADALSLLGAGIARDKTSWRVRGCGVGGFGAPGQTLHLGNAGTGVRLLMGALASSPHAVRLSGDASLSRRPMARVLAPLRAMGVMAHARAGEHLPLRLIPPPRLSPVRFTLPVPSAQVKSALIFAALGAGGESEICEPVPSRDHTERMLPLFGGVCRRTAWRRGWRLSIPGDQSLRAARVRMAGDPSAAAFLMVAASICRGAEIRLKDCMLNPHRLGFVRALTRMGGALTRLKTRRVGGEEVADFHVRAAPLRGIRAPARDAPAMIDEIPILAVAAAFARGRTKFAGLSELRVKESDRLAAIYDGLSANGVPVRRGEDWLEIQGADTVPGGGFVRARRDHRIAMAFLVLGMAAEQPVRVDSADMIATSYPNFFADMRALGAQLDG